MNKGRKPTARLDCLIVLPKEFIAVDNGNVYTAPNMAGKDILEYVQSSKNIIDADSDDTNGMNNSSCFHIIQNE
ncbi:hypothetical protein TNCV_4868861 [Trichonephila clavipes]|nr:hypothetical protein TNCV_4868861 [Trichonephila clavipes]